jgi:hypothetical protein
VQGVRVNSILSRIRGIVMKKTSIFSGLLVVCLLGIYLSLSIGICSAAAICTPPVQLYDVSNPTAVVGNGTPSSCTQAALQTAANGRHYRVQLRALSDHHYPRLTHHHPEGDRPRRSRTDHARRESCDTHSVFRLRLQPENPEASCAASDLPEREECRRWR